MRKVNWMVMIIVMFFIVGVVSAVLGVYCFLGDTQKNEEQALRHISISLEKNREGMLEGEVKEHVFYFHRLLFTMLPDKEFIEKNIFKAIYLCDVNEVYDFYKAFKQKEIYNDIIAGSATMMIKTDSVQFDKETMSFKFFGTQNIERGGVVLQKQLITSGRIKRIERFEDNPCGLFITNWKILLKKNIEK